jgi:hypothetical protein
MRGVAIGRDPSAANSGKFMVMEKLPLCIEFLMKMIVYEMISEQILKQ